MTTRLGVVDDGKYAIWDKLSPLCGLKPRGYNGHMANKKMTIENLAEMMEAGFTKVTKETDKKIDDLAVMVQGGLQEVHEEINTFRAEVNERFDAIDRRLDRIENVLIAGHDRRPD